MLLRCKQRNRGRRDNRNARGERRAESWREGSRTPTNANHGDRGRESHCFRYKWCSARRDSLLPPA
jgi:hypothetical protein